MLMFECFFFKDDLPIGIFMIHALDPINEIIKKVGYVKRDDQHFDLLSQMDTFMINEDLIRFIFFFL